MSRRLTSSGLLKAGNEGLFRAEDFERAFDRAFAITAFIMNRHLVDHMVRSSRRFGIDFETLVIWAVVAHQNCAHLMPPGSTPSMVLNDRGRLPVELASELRPLRLRDVTQISGVPRETARRKLRILQQAGWLLRTEAGWIVNRDRTEPDLREFSLETLRRFLATANDLVRVLESAHRSSGV